VSTPAMSAVTASSSGCCTWRLSDAATRSKMSRGRSPVRTIPTAPRGRRVSLTICPPILSSPSGSPFGWKNPALTAATAPWRSAIPATVSVSMI
jgi:hypothetical protein